MTLGTICRLVESSSSSLKIYTKLKKTLPFLVCPCSWKGKVVVVQECLSQRHFVVSLKDNEKLMSVCDVGDLRSISQR